MKKYRINSAYDIKYKDVDLYEFQKFIYAYPREFEVKVDIDCRRTSLIFSDKNFTKANPSYTPRIATVVYDNITPELPTFSVVDNIESVLSYIKITEQQVIEIYGNLDTPNTEPDKEYKEGYKQGLADGKKEMCSVIASLIADQQDKLVPSATVRKVNTINFY